MSNCRSKGLIFLLFFFIIMQSKPVCAVEPSLNWFEFEFGSSLVTAHRIVDGQKTLLMDGLLNYAYPDGFQIQYFTHTAPVTITSQKDFMQVKRGSDIQYGYDNFWLFEDFKQYIFALAEFSRIPMEFSGVDIIADRKANRFMAIEDPNLVLWFDHASGLPLLIRQEDQTLVTVLSYASKNNKLTSLDLQLSFSKKSARIVLECESSAWTPSLLEIQDRPGMIQIELADWSYTDEWEENPLPRLQTLSELNEVFLEEFAAKNYEIALGIGQQMLNLAPQFWQIYLYQAFAYEGLDNFLGVVENYQQVLMRDPDNHLALNNLAYHYFLREIQISQAIEMAKRAVELERRDTYLDTLGYGYYLVGRYEEAEELLIEALKTAPDDAISEITEHLNLVQKALGEDE